MTVAGLIVLIAWITGIVLCLLAIRHNWFGFSNNMDIEANDSGWVLIVCLFWPIICIMEAMHQLSEQMRDWLRL